MAIAIVALAETATAQNLDCGAVLRARAFDTTSLSISQDILITRRDNICSRDYSSLEEARTSARSGGFNVGYAGLSIGASEAKTNQNGRYEISETEFCKATLDDFASAFALNYEETVASIAVQNWLQCVRVAGANRLYMSYTLRGDGSYFDGNLHRSLSGESTTTTALAVDGLNVVGPGKDGVECVIAGETTDAERIRNKPIEITATTAPIACSRTNDKDVSIGINTTSGTLATIYLPSPQAQEAEEIASLKAIIQRLLAENASQTEVASGLVDRVSNLETNQQNEIIRMNGVQENLGSIQQQLPNTVRYGQAISLRSVEGYLYSNNRANRDEIDLQIVGGVNTHTQWTVGK